MKHGDFTALAENYARYRPGYSPFVLDAFLGLLPDRGGRVCVDAGAGTGIWSRQLAERGLKVYAVEPNEAMRMAGIKQTEGASIEWLPGSAESTGLPDGCADFVCMASSFHWPDFNEAVTEISRLLKNRGGGTSWPSGTPDVMKSIPYWQI